MVNFHFEGMVNVEIQGARVLELVKRHPNYAEYNVIGFGDKVTIHDYRHRVLSLLDAIINGQDASQFGDIFSSPAHANISVPEKDEVFVQLHEADNTAADNVLWIAVGLRDNLPVQDYLLRQIAPFDEGRFAFLGFYRQSFSFQRRFRIPRVGTLASDEEPSALFSPS